MERLPPFKSGNPTTPAQRAPAAKTTAAARPPVTTTNPQRPSMSTTSTGARPKTSAGDQKTVVSGSAAQEDMKSSKRGSISGTTRR